MVKKENRHNRAEIAKQTLGIIQSGTYQVGSKSIDITEWVQDSIEKTKLYSPNKVEQLCEVIGEKLKRRSFETVVSVHNETTLEGVAELVKNHDNVGLLNFASAKNPGGGFLGGAQAQEESIARASTLYSSIVQMDEMYDYNKSNRTYLYSDYMIFSRDIVVFRDDSLNLLEIPYKVHTVTSPAVNVGAILNNKPEELDYVEEVMVSRIDKMLAVFVEQEVEHLVLGAWGCGVFRNDPIKIATYFQSHLKSGGKYHNAFKTIRFSVLDRRDRGVYTAFRMLNEIIN